MTQTFKIKTPYNLTPKQIQRWIKAFIGDPEAEVEVTDVKKVQDSPGDNGNSSPA